MLLVAILLENKVPAVLRNWCFSVGEPILGSTPARAILGTLVTPTLKHSLISGVVSMINIGSSVSGSFTAKKTQTGTSSQRTE